jgi:hypothetical protein
VVFLYRHALELYIKAILLGEGANFLDDRLSADEVLNKNHRLTELLGLVRKIFEALGWENDLGNEVVPTFDAIEKAVAEIEEVDPNSHAFRYPVKKNLEGSVESHFTFSVAEFAERMDAVLRVFAGAYFGLPEKWSAESEARGYSDPPAYDF